MPKSKIWFDLTHDQAEALEPLFDKTYKAGCEGHPGMIILQPWGNSAIRGGFIPEKYAIRIIEILEEIGK